MQTIRVKILGYRTPQRYAVRRTVQSAFQAIRQKYPEVDINILEVTEVAEILKITPVFIYVSVTIEDKLVCVGRFPKKEEAMAWLEAAILEKQKSAAV